MEYNQTIIFYSRCTNTANTSFSSASFSPKKKKKGEKKKKKKWIPDDIDISLINAYSATIRDTGE